MGRLLISKQIYWCAWHSCRKWEIYDIKQFEAIILTIDWETFGVCCCWMFTELISILLGKLLFFCSKEIWHFEHFNDASRFSFLMNTKKCFFLKVIHSICFWIRSTISGNDGNNGRRMMSSSNQFSKRDKTEQKKMFWRTMWKWFLVSSEFQAHWRRYVSIDFINWPFL